MEEKLNLNLKDTIKDWTSLYYLIDSSDGSETEILQILIKSGSLINISDNFGITSILIQNNADINALDTYNRLPLNYAIIEGQLISAYLLLEGGS